MVQHKRQHITISVSQLQETDGYEIETAITPESLDLQEQDGIRVIEPIMVEATAYLTDGYLIIHYSLDAQVEIACALCNEAFVLPIHLQEIIHEEALEDIQGGVFDLTSLIRETIFLELPLFPQCGGTSCLNRHEIEKFISKKTGQEGERRGLDVESLKFLDDIE